MPTRATSVNLRVPTNRSPKEAQVDIHKNARLTPQSRVLLVGRILEQGWTVLEATQAVGVSERTGWKWLARYREGGLEALSDRSSRPRRLRRIGARARRRIVQLRRARLTCRRIATAVQRSPATVARVLKAAGLSRWNSLDAVLPPQRYERSTVGELLHIDTKKLGRIGVVGHRITGNRAVRVRRVGWEFLHVCVDDASRLAYAEILEDERKAAAIAFLDRAVAWFAARGVQTRELMTDNGSAYRSHAFAAACRRLSLRHIRTRPYTPRTNGKVERLIQTLLREWAYRLPFRCSADRHRLLAPFLHFYNHHRAHTALSGRPPISKLNLNNVLRLDT